MIKPTHRTPWRVRCSIVSTDTVLRTSWENRRERWPQISAGSAPAAQFERACRTRCAPARDETLAYRLKVASRVLRHCPIGLWCRVRVRLLWCCLPLSHTNMGLDRNCASCNEGSRMYELFARSSHRICVHGLSPQTRRVFKAQTRTNSKRKTVCRKPP